MQWMYDSEGQSRLSEMMLCDMLYATQLLVCSKDVSILHRFRDITTSTVYVTACDLEKSFSFDTTVELYATYAF